MLLKNPVKNKRKKTKTKTKACLLSWKKNVSLLLPTSKIYRNITWILSLEIQILDEYEVMWMNILNQLFSWNWTDSRKSLIFWINFDFLNLLFHFLSYFTSSISSTIFTEPLQNTTHWVRCTIQIDCLLIYLLSIIKTQTKAKME